MNNTQITDTVIEVKSIREQLIGRIEVLDKVRHYS